MSLLRNITTGFRSLFRKEQVERELDEELRGYLQMAAEEKMNQGMSHNEALRNVRLERGNLEITKQVVRSAGWESFVETCWQDSRLAARALCKSPGFTFVAVLTLALGIAANTTIFSAVSAMLLRKPVVENPDSLCAVTSTSKADAALRWVSAPDFKSWKEQNHTFEDMAAVKSGRSFTLTGKGVPESVEGERVTPEYFKVLGIPPLLGRTFLPSESEAGNSRVVVLSNSLWRERYGSDPNIIGERLDVDGVPHAVIGVVPERASLPLHVFPPRLWTPLVFGADDLKARDNHYINAVIARLKPGMTVEGAQADMDSIAEQLAIAYPDTNKHWGVSVLTVQEYLIREAQVRPAMVLLLAAVGLVLLMACANIAGLLLSRGAVRAHEMAVRVAIGAGRVRLIRQMLTESLLMGIVGGTAGLVLSIWGIHLLRAGFNFNDYGAQLGQLIHLDNRTLLFTLALSVLSAILFGLAPAFRASKVDIGHMLNEGGRTGSGNFLRSRLRSTLVSSEIALAILLLSSAGIAIREVIREFSQPAGFNAHHLVIADLHLEGKRYGTAAARLAFFQQIIEGVKTLPGVDNAALDNCVPLGCGYSTSFRIIGQSSWPESKNPSANYYVVSADYFQTLQIPLIRGREFRASDDFNAPTVAIVSQEFARRYFPKGDAIGHQIEAKTLNAKPAQIVGIAGNTNEYVGQVSADPQIYECDLQFPVTAFSGTSLIVRSRITTSALVPRLRQAVWSIDKDQPVGVQTIEDLISDNVGGDKLIAALFGTFAGLALLLAAIGIYGIVAYSVSQRTREIGVRVALGARSKDVLGLVLWEGGLRTVMGCPIGALLAIPMPRVFATIFDRAIAAQGPLIAIAVSFLVAIVALLACYIPARRAMRVDPLVALRYE